MQRIFLVLLLMMPIHATSSTESADIANADLVKNALQAEAAGDYKTTYSIWEKLHERGDYKAAVAAGLMHHKGAGRPVDYAKAMDWYLKAANYNADAMNNIGVLYRDGLGIAQNRKIAYLLFLTIHMESMGNEETIMRANRNLRLAIAEMPQEERQEALCYTLGYLTAYVEDKGAPAMSPKEAREASKLPRIRDLRWWAPGEVGEFKCPENT